MSMTDAQVDSIVARITDAVAGGAPRASSAHTSGPQQPTAGQNAAALADYQRLLGEQAKQEALINQTPPRLREITEVQCPGCGEFLFLEPGYYKEDDELGISYFTIKPVINHQEKCPVAAAEAAQAAVDGL